MSVSVRSCWQSDVSTESAEPQSVTFYISVRFSGDDVAAESTFRYRPPWAKPCPWQRGKLRTMQASSQPSDQALRVAVDPKTSVSALLRVPESPIACYVFAHGAGAGMAHPFMQTVADGLAERHIATLRYQFPYMERGSERPDTPAVAHAAVRAAVHAAHQATRLPLVAGGKSFGGRMTSQAQALAPMVGSGRVDQAHDHHHQRH